MMNISTHESLISIRDPVFNFKTSIIVHNAPVTDFSKKVSVDELEKALNMNTK